jgi:hypothetical protein
MKHWLILLVAPFAIAGLCLHLVPVRSAIGDYGVLTVAVLAGATGIALAPWPARTRLIAAACYVPIMAVTVAASMLAAVCATGNCL